MVRAWRIACAAACSITTTVTPAACSWPGKPPALGHQNHALVDEGAARQLGLCHAIDLHRATARVNYPAQDLRQR